jgi:hypothetical protein
MIEEIRATEHAEITEFLIGEGALLDRLSAMGLFRWKKKGYRVRWNQIDWSDLESPRLTCPVTDLQPL